MINFISDNRSELSVHQPPMLLFGEMEDFDAQLLVRALDLAESGRGATGSNPIVGAVVAREGQVIGEGFHQIYGGPHAEINAIDACGDRDTQGATLYVSLEPCAHHGKTPPCTDAIRAAGIARVVVGADDPSEHASGRGLGILRDEGIEVVMVEGELAERARRQNQPFRKHARTGQPHVTLKSAISLDGKVATHTGDSKWISSADSRELVHQWRSGCDAVAVGSGTAIADDPLLTARPKDGSRSQPLRVVFDSLGRLCTGSRLVASQDQAPLVVVVSRAAPREATDALIAAGVEIIVGTGENQAGQVRSALTQLAERGVRSLLLEGGPKLAAAFLEAESIDRAELFVAPIFIGGSGAPSLFAGAGVESVDEAIRPTALRWRSSGSDLWLTVGMREW